MISGNSVGLGGLALGAGFLIAGWPEAEVQVAVGHTTDHLHHAARAVRDLVGGPVGILGVLPYNEVKEPALVADSLLGAFAMATRTDNEIRELSPEEWDQRVDEQARKRLGMSGEEFERRLNAGEIDIDDSPDVTRVAMMLPLHATHK